MKQTFTRVLASSILALVSQFELGLYAHAADVPAPAVIRFDIARFEVTGNTLLPDDLVLQVVAPFIGKNRDFADVQKALEALEGLYHQRGYNVVQVELPEQELNQGVVKLKVVQTKIGRVKVEGNTWFTTENIRRSLPGLVEGQTPNIRKVSASMRMANENPSKKIALQLESGERDGEVDAVLKVADEKTWRLGANFDNTGTESTGKTHLGLLAQHSNLWGLDHVGSVQYTTALEKPSQIAVWGLGYHLPLYALGDSLDFFASYSDVDSGTVSAGVFDLLVSGKGRVYGMRYNRNLGRYGEFEPKLSVGLDYKAFINSVQLNGLQLGKDVVVHPLSVAFTGSNPIKDGDVNFGLTLIRNFPGGKNGRAADFNAVRSGADAQYFIARYNFGFNRNLPKDWQFRFALNGQLSRDALVPGEQFGAGGASSVRGFNERELANDYGVGMNAELYSPNFCSSWGQTPLQCRAVFFYDGAHAERNKALAGEMDSTTISSMGFGLRFLAGRHISAQMDLGRVLQGGGIKRSGQHHMHFKLNFSY